jgi:N-acylglucosamine-6-phosphate 2-epimerase
MPPFSLNLRYIIVCPIDQSKKRFFFTMLPTIPQRLPFPSRSLIVSVQASHGEPLYPTPILEALCHSVVQGGAMGLRIATPALIKPLKQAFPQIPIIALTKPEPLPRQPENHVYITATLADALQLAQAGADVVAIDATTRLRPDGLTLQQVVSQLKAQYPTVAIMADVDSLASAKAAHACGVDIISTTLAGYTAETLASSPKNSPDFDLLAVLIHTLPTVPIIAEGRFWTPEEVAKALALGAFAVVVGSAITRPHYITARFLKAF